MVAILDPRVLDQLGRDAEDFDVAVRFAERYRSMLGGRVHRIVEALYSSESARNNDMKDAIDAVLSLRTSSLIVGGSELADLAASMLTSLRAGDLRGATVVAGKLSTASGRLDKVLADYLQHFAAGPGAPQRRY